MREYETKAQAQAGCDRPQPGLQSSLTPSLDGLLKERIQRLRDEAFRLESLSRELPAMSHESTRALWDLCCVGMR